MRNRSSRGSAALAVAAAGIATSLAVAGCGSSSPSPATKATSAAKASGSTNLVIWTDAQRAPVLAKFANQFGKDNGIKVSVQPVSTDLQTTFTTAASAGKGPDVVVGATDWIGNLVQNGAIVPLPMSTAQQGAFEKTAINAVTYNGQVYGVPYATENLALFTNTAISTTVPATFEQMVQAGKAAVAAKKATLPADIQIGQTGDPYTMEPFYTSAGGYLFGTKPNGTYDPADLGVGKPGSLTFARLLAKYGEKGQKVFTRSVDPNNAISLFTAGKSPYLVSGPWAIPQLKQAGIKYRISPVPGFAGMGPARPFVGVQAFYVSSKAKNAALAQSFVLNYMTRDSVEEALFNVEPRPPALTTAYDKEAAADPDIAAFAAAAKDGQVLPQIPAMSSVWTPLGDAEAAIVGGASPAGSISGAATQIQKAIKK